MQNESIDLGRSARATSKARAVCARVIAGLGPRMRRMGGWPGATRRCMAAHPTRATAVTATLCTLLAFAIPDYYTLKARIPPFEQLKRSDGVLEFTRHYKAGVRPRLNMKEATLLFTCAEPNTQYGSCLSNESIYAGKRAVIWWYEMPSYPFATIRYAVRIDVEDTTVLSYTSSVERLTSSQAGGWAMSLSFALFFCGPWVLATYLYQRWKGSKQS